MSTSLRLIKHMGKQVMGVNGSSGGAKDEPVEKASLHAVMPKVDELMKQISESGWPGDLLVEHSKCTLKGPDVVCYPVDEKYTMTLEVRDVRGELMEMSDGSITAKGRVEESGDEVEGDNQVQGARGV